MPWVTVQKKHEGRGTDVMLIKTYPGAYIKVNLWKVIMQPQLEFKGYALIDAKNFTDLQVKPFRPEPFEDDDIEITIMHCGICGSDVHTLKQGWGDSKLPLIIGHEIAGEVVRVGRNMKEFKVGNRIRVGAQIWSCSI